MYAPCAIPSKRSTAETSARRVCISRKQCCEGIGGSSDSVDAVAVRPVDPNEKLVAARRFIRNDQKLLYPIHYENIGNIEAKDIFIRDVIDSNLDPTTLELITSG